MTTSGVAKRALVNIAAFAVWAAAYLLCSGIARVLVVIVNGSQAVPDSPWDYIVGVFASVVAAFAGILLASEAIKKWFGSVRVRKIAWVWWSVLLCLWLFALLGVVTNNDAASLFVFFTAEVAMAGYLTKSLD